jgi:hypothetical protein
MGSVSAPINQQRVVAGLIVIGPVAGAERGAQSRTCSTPEAGGGGRAQSSRHFGSIAARSRFSSGPIHSGQRYQRRVACTRSRAPAEVRAAPGRVGGLAIQHIDVVQCIYGCGRELL